MSGRGPAKPLGLVLLGVGSVLSIATSESALSYVHDVEGAGAVELHDMEMATVEFEVIASCSPGPTRVDLRPYQASFGVEALAVLPDEPSDSGARPNVWATVTVDGAAVAEWEALDFLDQSYLGAHTLETDALLADCEPDAPCVREVAVTYGADADVRIEWTASSSAWWYDQGAACAVLFWQLP